jgi:hypothetical protein
MFSLPAFCTYNNESVPAINGRIQNRKERIRKVRILEMYYTTLLILTRSQRKDAKKYI